MEEILSSLGDPMIGCLKVLSGIDQVHGLWNVGHGPANGAIRVTALQVPTY